MAIHHAEIPLPITANLLYVSVAKIFPLYMYSSSVLDLQVIWLSYGNVSLFTIGNWAAILFETAHAQKLDKKFEFLLKPTRDTSAYNVANRCV